MLTTPTSRLVDARASLDDIQSDGRRQPRMTIFGFLNFNEPLWVYISIPIAAAVVGWFTKIVAVNMMFYPVEFKGIRPYLGWQGQIPKHAAKMAGIAVDSVTSDGAQTRGALCANRP